jgi:hypothetical protein
MAEGQRRNMAAQTKGGRRSTCGQDTSGVPKLPGRRKQHKTYSMTLTHSIACAERACEANVLLAHDLACWAAREQRANTARLATDAYAIASASHALLEELHDSLETAVEP